MELLRYVIAYSGMLDYRFIVIGRGAEDLLRFVPAERVGVFESMLAFDRWRFGLRSFDAFRTIAADVDAALAVTGRGLDDFHGELRVAFERLRARTVVPFVCDLVPAEISERTFYRRWDDAFGGETPKRFLARVRVHHVRRLIERRGLSEKEAAWRAGFASVWHLRQSLNCDQSRKASSSGS